MWKVETNNGNFKCRNWRYVIAENYYYPKDEAQYRTAFVIFQDSDGVWRFIENSDINWLEEEKE